MQMFSALCWENMCALVWMKNVICNCNMSIFNLSGFVTTRYAWWLHCKLTIFIIIQLVLHISCIHLMLCCLLCRCGAHWGSILSAGALVIVIHQSGIRSAPYLSPPAARVRPLIFVPLTHIIIVAIKLF